MNYGEFKILVAALSVASLTLQGCGKYEDGPAISLKTKNSRLTGEWNLIEVGNDILDDIEVVFEFEDDGDFKMQYEYNYEGYSQSYAYKGEWEWVSGKESILVNLDGDVMKYNILKLESKDMVLEYEYGSVTVEYVFEKQ